MRHTFPLLIKPLSHQLVETIRRILLWIILSGLGLILVSIFSLAQADESAINSKGSPVLLVLGDSLSAGYGLTMEKSWVALLQQSKESKMQIVQVVNASISGETTSGGKSRLPALMKKYSPKWLIIELGANDALRGQNLSVSQKNIASMIALAQQKGTKVMLLGIRLPTNYGPAYDKRLQKMYVDLAKQYDLIFDPFFLEDVALDPKLMQADALDPNEAAQPLILERLFPKISLLLK